MPARVHRWLDAAAIGASTVCLLHCLAIPLLIAALPLVAGLFAPDETVHRVLVAFALPTSALALFLGHKRHRHLAPPAGGALGLLLLGIAPVVDGLGAETAATVSGSMLLATAHLLNWRLGLQGG